MTNPHKGSSLDSFLQEEGILESVEENAKRRVEKMSEIKICKDDKYYSLSYFDNGRPTNGRSIWLSTEGGDGMEVGTNEDKLYDAIDKFFQEKM